ncbi:MAG TPA: heme exporter protein CcmD [Terriglobia bacterium]|nr:heme exporter protein CcmD [Terriglobia bacterium]
MSHAFYVWAAYALTFAALFAEVFTLVRRRRAIQRNKHPNGESQS